MTDTLFELVPVYGIWVIAAATYFSCLAVPVPSSLMMLAGGAFVASGDLALWSVALGAWGGAILGDQTGFAIGASGRRVLLRIARPGTARARLLEQAQRLLARRGTLAVFLTRWLFSPLGPYVNLLGGAGGLAWPRFSAGSATGEAVWVVLYVGLGYSFAGQITTVAEMTGDAAGLLAALAVLGLLGRTLWKSHNGRRHQAKTRTGSADL